MILFFDTETTGLPKNWKAPVTDLDNWPRLVQLAYLVYDFDGNLIHSCNEIVKPNGFRIPIDASKVHRITTNIANQRGGKIEDVFELFSIHLKRAKVIVAHNMAFDEKIIGAELIRLRLENILDGKEKICTMESSVDLCKIEGPYGYKWPKLEELHQQLFNVNFDGAHDALADIQATAKCFWELIKNQTFNEIQLNNTRNNQNLHNFHKTNIKEFKAGRVTNANAFLPDSNSCDSSMNNVPFLKINKKGNSSWQFYNYVKESFFGDHFEDHYEVEKEIKSTLTGQSIYFFRTIFTPKYTGHLIELSEWGLWTTNEDGDLFFDEKFKLNIFDLNLNFPFIDGDPIIRFLDATNQISKLVSYCQDGDEDGRIDDWYQTIFYINNKGRIFLENNYSSPK